MTGQLATVYFQAYQLAYELARRAERAFRFDLASPGASFLQFGYWDSLRKGLLAGEKLQLDLRRMEVAYLDQNRREHEVVKPVSLAQLDPEQFLRLRETGQCTFTVPETVFDRDHAGHYLRRLRSVSVTVPCVAGPYTGVHGRLTLVASSIRMDPSLLDGTDYLRRVDPEDPRFTDDYSAGQVIAVSHGQNDTGLFDANGRDDRLLPFEGAGAISTWRLDLPPGENGFDFSTITDVVLHLRFTARDGGEAFAAAVRSAVVTAPEGAPTWAALFGPVRSVRLVSLRHEFPTEWNHFLETLVSDPGGDYHLLTFTLGTEHFPYRHGKVDVQVPPGGTAGPITAFFKVKNLDGGATVTGTTLLLSGDPAPVLESAWTSAPPVGDVAYRWAEFAPTAAEAVGAGAWELRVPSALDPETLQDVLLVIPYEYP